MAERVQFPFHVRETNLFTIVRITRPSFTALKQCYNSFSKLKFKGGEGEGSKKTKSINHGKHY